MNSVKDYKNLEMQQTVLIKQIHDLKQKQMRTELIRAEIASELYDLQKELEEVQKYLQERL